MPLVRNLALSSALTLGALAIVSCSTSNTSSGSAGSINLTGTWVGNITSSTEGFNVRTMRVNLTQEHSSNSCFSISGTGTITAVDGSADEAIEACWLGGIIKADTATITCGGGSDDSNNSNSSSTSNSASISNASNAVSGLTPEQYGTLAGSQVSFEMEMSSGVTMTFSGTTSSNYMAGYFSSTKSETCPAMAGSFKLSK